MLKESEQQQEKAALRQAQEKLAHRQRKTEKTDGERMPEEGRSFWER